MPDTNFSEAVMDGFYKQAAELGYQKEVVDSFLESLQKTADDFYEEFVSVSNSFPSPALYKAAFVEDITEHIKQADFLQDLQSSPIVQNLIESLKQGGASGAGWGAGLGGAGGLLLSLLMGKSPLAGLLLGGGLGAGAGGFGRQLYDQLLAGRGQNSPQETPAAEPTADYYLKQHPASALTAATSSVPQMGIDNPFQGMAAEQAAERANEIRQRAAADLIRKGPPQMEPTSISGATQQGYQTGGLLGAASAGARQAGQTFNTFNQALNLPQGDGVKNMGSALGTGYANAVQGTKNLLFGNPENNPRYQQALNAANVSRSLQQHTAQPQPVMQQNTPQYRGPLR